MRTMGIHTHWISGQQPHLIKHGQRIDCNISNYVPFVVPGLSTSSSTTPTPLLQHLHHRILYLTSADTLKIQYPKEVEVRVRSYGETRCIDQQETESTSKNEGREEVQSDLLHDLPDWLQELRENLVDERSSLQPLRQRIKTLPSHLMNFQWSREQKWNRVRVSAVSALTSRKTQTAISA